MLYLPQIRLEALIMGLFDGLLGNNTKTDTANVTRELQSILISNETVDLAFTLIRDLVVFTNKRLIIVDKQGVTGKKSQYHSIPYRSISHFSIETSGRFDLDAELDIWISSAVDPTIKLPFRKDDSILAIQQALATAVLH